MADRVYPTSKPNPHHPPSAAAAANGGAPNFPATKAQTYGRPTYRPQPPPKRRRSRRSCWCSCCLWLTLIILALLFLSAIAGGVFYLWYRPHRPSFKVTSLRLAQLNVSSSNSLDSRLDLTILARNPNSKIAFVYDPISISVASNGVSIGDGSFPAFVSAAKNNTLMKTTVSSSDQSIDKTTASALKGKSKLLMEIELETKAGVKIGGMKSKKIGIKVICNGVNVANPKKKVGSNATAADFYCKVKLRIKIWLWTIA